MSAPHYFLPGVYRAQLLTGGKLSQSLLAARGLLPIFGDVVDTVSELSLQELPGSGPGGVGGTMLVPLVPGAEPPVRLGYRPEYQEWNQIGDYWLGIDRESPPGPDDLRRRKLIGGYWQELSDGNRWIVPILRRPDDSTELPCSFGWDAGGAFRETVRGEHRQLWQESAEIVDWFLSGTINDLTFIKANLPRIIDWCVRILQVNYRFDRSIQSHAGTIGSQDWALLLAHAIDWVTAQVLDTQKKTEHESQQSPENPPCDAGAIILPGSAADAAETIAQVAASV